MRGRRRALWLVGCIALGGAGIGLLPAAQPASGEAVYKTYCALCHQQGAEGLTGQFPRLKGRLNLMLAQPQSRRYAMQVVLNGMAGGIDVDHGHIVGVMPPLRTLSDQDIAAVLTYVAGLDGSRHAKPVIAAEVEQARMAPALSATDMREERAKLVQAESLP